LNQGCQYIEEFPFNLGKEKDLDMLVPIESKMKGADR